MKRPLFFCVLALLTGIYTAFFMPDAIAVLPLGFLALVLFVLACFRKCTLAYCLMVLCFLSGAVYLLMADSVENRPLYPFSDEYITVTAEVIQEPEIEKDGSAATVVRVTELSFLKEEVTLCEKVRLSFPAGGPLPVFGERFQAVCRLYLPNDAMNSRGFDYQLHLKSKGIFFSGYVEPDTVEITGTFPLSFSERLYRLNRRCGKSIDRLFPRDAAAVLKAMALGDKSGISDELQEALSVSGLSHVTAVSGMHVTTLLTGAYFLLALLERNKYKFFVPLCGVVLIFMLFTGASPSVVRAAIMCVMALCGFLLFRKADPLTSLGFSAGVIVAIRPFAALDIGFMLSFAATLGILLLATPLERLLSGLFCLDKSRGLIPRLLSACISLICVSFSAQLFVLPLAASIFGTTSLWSLLTNLLVAPLLPVMLIGGLLIGFLGLIHSLVALPVAGFVYPFAKLFLKIVCDFGSREAGLLTVGAFSVFGLYLYGLWIFAFERGVRKRYLQAVAAAISFLLLLLCVLGTNYSLERAELTFINVGQGDCAWLTLPRNINILIDGGGVAKYQDDYEIGRKIVLPYLQKEGVHRLDYMIASHPHEDHINGLISVLEEMPVETLLVPIGFERNPRGQVLLDRATQQGTEIVMLQSGDEKSLGNDCTLTVLMPEELWLESVENENDLSLVCKLTYGDTAVLLPGDLEQEGEAALVSAWPSAGKVDILKVSHHGSATSTTEAFVDWAQPSYAYIPCGENQFGPPANNVLEQLLRCGAVIYRADEDKDVTFTLTKEGIYSIKKGGATP